MYFLKKYTHKNSDVMTTIPEIVPTNIQVIKPKTIGIEIKDVLFK